MRAGNFILDRRFFMYKPGPHPVGLFFKSPTTFSPRERASAPNCTWSYLGTRVAKIAVPVCHNDALLVQQFGGEAVIDTVVVVANNVGTV